MGTLTTAEAAELCGVAEVTIRLWVHRGYLKPVRMALVSDLRFREEDVLECLDRRRSKRWRQRLDALADTLPV